MDQKIVIFSIIIIIVLIFLFIFLRRKKEGISSGIIYNENNTYKPLLYTDNYLTGKIKKENNNYPLALSYNNGWIVDVITFRHLFIGDMIKVGNNDECGVVDKIITDKNFLIKMEHVPKDKSNNQEIMVNYKKDSSHIMIRCYDNSRGSGTIITKKHILTAAHVIEPTNEIILPLYKEAIKNGKDCIEFKNDSISVLYSDKSYINYKTFFTDNTNWIKSENNIIHIKRYSLDSSGNLLKNSDYDIGIIKLINELDITNIPKFIFPEKISTDLLTLHLPTEVRGAMIRENINDIQNDIFPIIYDGNENYKNYLIINDHDIKLTTVSNNGLQLPYNNIPLYFTRDLTNEDCIKGNVDDYGTDKQVVISFKASIDNLFGIDGTIQGFGLGDNNYAIMIGNVGDKYCIYSLGKGKETILHDFNDIIDDSKKLYAFKIIKNGSKYDITFKVFSTTFEHKISIDKLPDRYMFVYLKTIPDEIEPKKAVALKVNVECGKIYFNKATVFTSPDIKNILLKRLIKEGNITHLYNPDKPNLINVSSICYGNNCGIIPKVINNFGPFPIMNLIPGDSGGGMFYKEYLVGITIQSYKSKETEYLFGHAGYSIILNLFPFKDWIIMHIS